MSLMSTVRLWWLRVRRSVAGWIYTPPPVPSDNVSRETRQLLPALAVTYIMASIVDSSDLSDLISIAKNEAAYGLAREIATGLEFWLDSHPGGWALCAEIAFTPIPAKRAWASAPPELIAAVKEKVILA